MDGELWKGIYQLIGQESRKHLTPKHTQFSDAAIVRVYLWAVLHDRPTYWACRAENWPVELRWMRLPSPSTMSRRLRTLSVIHLIQAILDSLQPPEPALCRRIDTKPLPVGGFSKDHNARWGYATGGKAKGYKICCAWGAGFVPEAWRLAPLNRGDSLLGAEIIDILRGGGYLLADNTFDSNPLFDRAAEHGFQLLAPRKVPGAALGHRAHSPHRLRAIELLEGPGQFGPELYRLRGQIERDYGQLTCFGGGLQPLPSWVRRPRRVALWVAAKFIINGARILRIQ